MQTTPDSCPGTPAFRRSVLRDAITHTGEQNRRGLGQITIFETLCQKRYKMNTKFM